MTRLDKVRAYVEERCKEQLELGEEPGVQAQVVADALHIFRTDASADLNKLWRQGILEKVGKKPVRYRPAGLLNKQSQAFKGEGVAFGTREGVGDSRGKSRDEVYGGFQAPGIRRAPLSRGDSAFSGIIGWDGSLKAQVQLAKAAVSYPPFGLHTLIIGETGVGKTLLAEAMWRYGVETGVFRSSNTKNEAPFVMFSCSDYAENPQLLVSQLFGHVKGAFTGANEDKDGLVERAQGGVLFLDEIHRLPPSGQELLFTLIDRGVYRRLGDTRERTANLMIIGATSEDPQSALLAAFRRRIPVQIEIPRLKERPLRERLALITHFVSEESNRLGLPVSVSGRSLKLLLAYDCPGNVGDLRNDLQLCCARSYLSYLASRVAFNQSGKDASKQCKPLDYSGAPDRETLVIDIDTLPQRVYSTTQDVDFSGDPYVNKVICEGLVVYPGQKPASKNIVDEYEFPTDLYEFVERRIRTYQIANLSHEEIETRVGEDLEKYFYATIWAFRGDQTVNTRPGIISPVIWKVAVSILDTASERLGRNYSRTVLTALGLHLQQFLQRRKAGQAIYNPRLKYIQTKHSAEFQVVKDLTERISRALGVNVPEDEMGFLAMFLAQPVGMEKKPRVGLVVVSHGRATASSMADVANTLLGTSHVRAVDAPLGKPLSEVIEDVSRAVSQSDQGKGVLILADMGSFLDLEQEIHERTGVACRIIPGVTTLLVIEAGKMVMTSDGTLDEISAEVRKEQKNLFDPGCAGDRDLKGTPVHERNDQVRQLKKADLENLQGDSTRGAIITVCPTGAGTARKVRDILLKTLPICRTMDIIPVSLLDDVNEIAGGLGKRLRLVVGSVDPGLSGVPFVPVDEVLREDGLKKIDFLLKGWNPGKTPRLPDAGTSRQQALHLIRTQMDKFVSNLPASEVVKQCDYVLEALEKNLYKEELPVDVMVRVYLHAACMLDRLAGGQPLGMPRTTAELNVKEERSGEFEFLESLLRECASQFNLSVPDGEVFYFLVSLPEPGKL